MPFSDHFSIDRQPEPFNPKNLRRSVIAAPLREEIERETKVTNEFIKKNSKLLQHFNTVVFFRGRTQKQISESRKRVLKRLDRAVEELGGEKELGHQTIGEPLPQLGTKAGLAFLRSRVINLLLAMDAASDPIKKGGKPAPPAIDRIWPTRFEVIIDINLNYYPPDSTRREEGDESEQTDPRQVAKRWIAASIEEAKQRAHVNDPDQGIDMEKTRLSPQYVFARLEGRVIQELVAIDQRIARELAGMEAKPLARFQTIHRIWPDFKLRNCITQSISTVKADAAQRSFTAFGKNITWAVMDSGINAEHPHFRLHGNIDPASPYHKDFTAVASPGSALKDQYGHGTHVAGIIAGEQSLAKGSQASDMKYVWQELEEKGGAQQEQATMKQATLDVICGIAPECKLVSLRVLDRFGMGNASNAITAIAHVQEVNHHGRELHIHGVNLSLGYPFDPKWFACGHSPLCVEVNRLVRSGVVVVVAAGNSGYGTLLMTNGKSTDACLDLTINDPGNAECAITVGSTHRDMPHIYGVSYFSSKGPTGDGRCKPDLLAPGEKIVSCASPASKLVKEEADNEDCNYFETSGTSMAAPHVSGAIAAFLSIRKEFIGEPERVKKIFTSTATDLGRDRYFQGSGLLDLMRAIQSV